jgi:hypothetical protein
MSATERLTRLVVLGALSLATVVMFVVSSRGNYLYGYGLGQSPEKRELFAWANVAADVWKAFGLVAVAALWRERRRRAALLGSIAWLVCLAFGLNSALGVYVQDRTTFTGSREAVHATYREAEAELAIVERQLRALNPHRSTGEIEAAINAILSRGVSVGERLRGTIASLSLNCTKPDARTQEACAEIATLRQEFAVAAESRRLEARVSLLREQIVNLRARGGSIAADPVGEFYAWITGGYVSVRDVGFGFPLAFALLIEIVSAFGPVTIAGYADATRRVTVGRVGADLDMARHDRSGPALTDGRGDVGAVLSWIAERASPTNDNRALGIEELHHDFVAWSSTKAMLLERFQRAFDSARGVPELAGKIRKFGDRYYGIALSTTDLRSSRTERVANQ